MIRVFNFECTDCGHIEEHFIKSDVRELDCVKCGQPAKRLLATPRSKLDPLSGDFAGATITWARQRQKQIDQERKREAS